jgi:hypothetical protein
MTPEAAQQALSQLVELFVRPEIERRRTAGHPDEPVRAFQVVFEDNGAHQIRLNTEVRAVARAIATRAVAKGEPLTAEDISDVQQVELTDADPNAAHFTALLIGDGWTLAFDARYNAGRISEHLAAAENAFGASELLATAALLPIPDATTRTSKRHGTVAARHNQFAKAGGTETRFARLRNELERLRDSARYLRRELELDEARATEMLATLKEMREHSRDRAPLRRIG